MQAGGAAVAAGVQFSVLMKFDDTVLATGQNDIGQLGQPGPAQPGAGTGEHALTFRWPAPMFGPWASGHRRGAEASSWPSAQGRRHHHFATSYSGLPLSTMCTVNSTSEPAPTTVKPPCMTSRRFSTGAPLGSIIGSLPGNWIIAPCTT